MEHAWVGFAERSMNRVFAYVSIAHAGSGFPTRVATPVPFLFIRLSVRFDIFRDCSFFFLFAIPTASKRPRPSLVPCEQFAAGGLFGTVVGGTPGVGAIPALDTAETRSFRRL
jgi:hypothetical protein